MNRTFTQFTGDYFKTLLNLFKLYQKQTPRYIYWSKNPQTQVELVISMQRNQLNPGPISRILGAQGKTNFGAPQRSFAMIQEKNDVCFKKGNVNLVPFKISRSSQPSGPLAPLSGTDPTAKAICYISPMFLFSYSKLHTRLIRFIRYLFSSVNTFIF